MASGWWLVVMLWLSGLVAFLIGLFINECVVKPRREARLRLEEADQDDEAAAAAAAVAAAAASSAASAASVEGSIVDAVASSPGNTALRNAASCCAKSASDVGATIPAEREKSETTRFGFT